jgi:RNA polymerase sigma-70 factor (ECF subfamily)
MRRVDDLSQKEVAARLGVTQKTVEKHVIKGMQLLAEAMFGTAIRKQRRRRRTDKAVADVESAYIESGNHAVGKEPDHG